MATATISPISSATNTGMRHLMDQAHSEPKPEPRRAPPPPEPPDKCLKICVILDGSNYYVPLNGFGMNSEPPFQFQIPVAYSELRDPAISKLTNLLGIKRHELLEIYATGIRTEIVDLPHWWETRDAQ